MTVEEHWSLYAASGACHELRMQVCRRATRTADREAQVKPIDAQRHLSWLDLDDDFQELRRIAAFFATRHRRKHLESESLTVTTPEAAPV